MHAIEQKKPNHLTRTTLINSNRETIINQQNAPIMAAIIGDIIGSHYEFNPIKTKEFTLIDDRSQITDDTSMILAIKKAIDEGVSFEESLYAFGCDFPYLPYSESMKTWIANHGQVSQSSYGNGASVGYL